MGRSATASPAIVAATVTPPPSAVTSQDISNDTGNAYSETAIAYNPADTSQLLAGSNVTTSAQMAGFNSTNSGTNWASSPVTPPAPSVFGSDPSTGFDNASHAFYSYIGVDSNFNTTLYVAQSSASSLSWASSALTNPSTELPDKPMMAVDNVGLGTHVATGNVYIGYDSFNSDPYSNPIEVQTGNASGAFSEHQVWDSGGEFGADPAQDPSSGALYMAWVDWCGLTPNTLQQPCRSNFTGQLLMSESTDGGAAWSTPGTIAPLTTGAGSILPNYGGTCAMGCAPRPVTSFPSIAVDNSGDVVAVWADGADPQLGASTVPSAHRMHIYFSKWNGSTWSSPVQLDTGNPNDAWQPAISVDRSTGTLSVAWYDRRDDTNNHLYRPYYTQSTDGGATWSAQIPLSSTMSDPTIDCNGTGDYLQITSVGGHAYTAWTDMSGSVSQAWVSDVNETGSFTLTSGTPVASSVRDPSGSRWAQLPGSARDIGVGSDSSCTTAVTGTDNLAGGGGVYVWGGQSWFGPVAGGSGMRISVDAVGLPWIVNKDKAIYGLAPNGSGGLSWQHLPGSATDIGAGADYSVWVLGTNAVPGGYEIYDFDFSTGTWISPGGGGVRIAIGPDGEPWIVNSAGQIYCHTASSWRHLPGSAHDIGVGANGEAWVVGTNVVPGGYGIYRWSGSCAAGGGWVGVSGGAVAISVGVDGLPFLVNSTGRIYQRLF